MGRPESRDRASTESKAPSYLEIDRDVRAPDGNLHYSQRVKMRLPVEDAVLRGLLEASLRPDLRSLLVEGAIPAAATTLPEPHAGPTTPL
jgi:hypothetical protein